MTDEDEGFPNFKLNVPPQHKKTRNIFDSDDENAESEFSNIPKKRDEPQTKPNDTKKPVQSSEPQTDHHTKSTPPPAKQTAPRPLVNKNEKSHEKPHEKQPEVTQTDVGQEDDEEDEKPMPKYNAKGYPTTGGKSGETWEKMKEEQEKKEREKEHEKEMQAKKSTSQTPIDDIDSFGSTSQLDSETQKPREKKVHFNEKPTAPKNVNQNQPKVSNPSPLNQKQAPMTKQREATPKNVAPNRPAPRQPNATPKEPATPSTPKEELEYIDVVLPDGRIVKKINRPQTTKPKTQPPTPPTGKRQKKDTQFSSEYQPNREPKKPIIPPTSNITGEKQFALPNLNGGDQEGGEGGGTQSLEEVEDDVNASIPRAQQAIQFFLKNWKPVVWENPLYAAVMHCKMIHIIKGSDRAYKSYADLFKKANSYPMDPNEFAKKRALEREKKRQKEEAKEAKRKRDEAEKSKQQQDGETEEYMEEEQVYQDDYDEGSHEGSLEEEYDEPPPPPQKVTKTGNKQGSQSQKVSKPGIKREFEGLVKQDFPPVKKPRQQDQLNQEIKPVSKPSTNTTPKKPRQTMAQTTGKSLSTPRQPITTPNKPRAPMVQQAPVYQDEGEDEEGLGELNFGDIGDDLDGDVGTGYDDENGDHDDSYE